MLFVGITGGVGAGKSEILNYLGRHHGELSLEGRIDSLAYLGRKKEKQEESLIKRLFH